MPSILNCFKILFPRSQKSARRSQKQEPKLSAAANLDPAIAFPQSNQISTQAPATPTYDEVHTGTVKEAGGAELVTLGHTADRIEEPLTEEPEATPAATEEPPNQGQSSADKRPFVEERPSTNGLPRIEVRQATLLTEENVAAIPRSPSVGSLKTPTLSRDNSQTSQTSLRSQAGSKGSSTRGHWLKDQLEEAGLECPKHHHCYLIPKSVQEKFITVPNVVRDLQARNQHISDTDAENYANIVCARARKLYATLAYIKKGAEIGGLLAEGITDDDLPFVKTTVENRVVLSRRDGDTIETFDHWENKHLKKFDLHQWWMNSPVFKLNKDLYQLDEKTILPFVHFEGSKGKGGKKQQAGYSEVFPVKIHPAHHNFWESSGCLDDEPLVAVKRLYSDDKDEFEKERTILTAMGMKNHPHLIKLLATYKYDGKYHLMFPLANANLRQYWEDRPAPAFDRQTVLWSLQQMTGIANGLLRVHTYKVTQPLSISGPGNIRVLNDANLSVQKGEEWYGRHGDIKPENVLWFAHSSETENPMGILQIADFGLGRFHGRDSRSRVPPESVFSSPTYEPPECKLRLPVSRAYDMWSLGCLYLEFITWLLKGSGEIEGFSEFRGRQATTNSINDDNFFTIVTGAEGQKATVREQVVEWATELHGHDRCSALIHDLLDLTMNGLLVVESSARYPASWLFHKLDQHLTRAQTDEDYLLTPVPRKQKPEPERANTDPGTLPLPKTNSKTNSKPNSVVTFADEKTKMKESMHTTLPRDLVLRKSGMKTWPIHGPQPQTMVVELSQLTGHR